MVWHSHKCKITMVYCNNSLEAFINTWLLQQHGSIPSVKQHMQSTVVLWRGHFTVFTAVCTASKLY